ncbi:MAG TPA: ABC transporter [Acidimicrobiales bacterium]|nr:ABC transporter [Acidimicrobiales bacterium]
MLDLVAPLTEVRDSLVASRFDLEVDGAAEGRAARDAAVHQIDDYLLPRLRSLDAPLLAVVGGSTGAGKSTLVNSIVGEAVSTAGVLRPTTRAPVLVCHPDDRHWFEDDRVLPGLARLSGGGELGDQGTLRLVTSTGLPAGLALLDAPDIDSVVTANRELAAQLLAAADLWVFVTTAARYADAVPWDLLDAAGRRQASVAVVLDRVPPEAADEVAGDLRRLLADHGLGADALLQTIGEGDLEDDRLPESEVGPVRAWLVGLARDAEARSEVIRRTLEGALADLERQVAVLADASDAQERAATGLRDEVGRAYADGLAEVDEQVRAGALLRGEVLARWQEFVGTGELMRSVQARVGMLRDRVWSTVTGRPTSAEGVQEAVEQGVEAVVHAAADRAAGRTVSTWRRAPGGRALVAGRERELGRASGTLLERLPDEVRQWQSGVLDLVRVEGAGKRTSARIASFTLNGAGLAVMLAVFAQTGGLTGAEVAVAGGTSAASQKLIEAVFGDQAVRTLAREARERLLVRTRALLEDDASRFRALVDEADPAGQSARLREAVGRWRTIRGGAGARAVERPA